MICSADILYYINIANYYICYIYLSELFTSMTVYDILTHMYAYIYICIYITGLKYMIILQKVHGRGVVGKQLSHYLRCLKLMLEVWV